MTYTKLSDRSVETCEAYRRGRVYITLPLFSFKDMIQVMLSYSSIK